MAADTDDELEVEFEPEAADQYPSVIGMGEVFFYPDLGTFCDEHQAKAVTIAEDGSIWIYPMAGGAPVSLDKWKPPGTITTLKRVQ